MNKLDQDIQALEGSIINWKIRAEGEHTYPTTHNCPLCFYYYGYTTSQSFCLGCPVYTEYSPGCADTPVQAYENALDIDDMEEATKLAQEEVILLQGILDKIQS